MTGKPSEHLANMLRSVQIFSINFRATVVGAKFYKGQFMASFARVLDISLALSLLSHAGKQSTNRQTQLDFEKETTALQFMLPSEVGREKGFEKDTP